MSNPFKDWTPEDAERHNARVRARGLIPVPAPVSVPQIDVRAIPKTKRELLNKTEKLWKAELERRGHKIILVQAIMFRLGDRLQYRPDLITIESPGMDQQVIWITAYETKAPHRFAKASLAKPKMAASKYPFIKWVIVMRDKGKWTEKEIGNE